MKDVCGVFHVVAHSVSSSIPLSLPTWANDIADDVFDMFHRLNNDETKLVVWSIAAGGELISSIILIPLPVMSF